MKGKVPSLTGVLLIRVLVATLAVTLALTLTLTLIQVLALTLTPTLTCSRRLSCSSCRAISGRAERLRVY